MDERKRLILNTVIEAHIATGLPVSSGLLADKYNLPFSSATIRNEMADLEEEGYIRQPHTSAGRVPTEEAYRWFVGDLKQAGLSSAESDKLIMALGDKSELSLKSAAKELAAASNLAVFWAFNSRDVYYTGITNLLSQPEFASQGLIYNLSAIIDRLDEIIGSCFESLPAEPSILIGSDCPFGDFLSSAMAKYKRNGHKGAFGLISPMRTDYARNLSFVSLIKNQL